MPIAEVNGTSLFYLEVGTGTPCFVMHGGLGFDHTYLHPWLDPLSDVLRLIYYDHRGNGRSGRPAADTLTFDHFSDDADALRRRLGLERMAVMGHSFGGFIALAYALRFPERVTHLTLVDTAPAFNYLDEVLANARHKGADEETMAVLQAPSPASDAELMRSFQAIAPLYFHRRESCFTTLKRDRVQRLGSGAVRAIAGRVRCDFPST